MSQPRKRQVADGHGLAGSVNLDTAKAAAKVWIAEATSSAQAIDAASFARLSLETYAACVHPKLHLFAFSSPMRPLGPEANALATELGILASKLGSTEALYQLTSLYPALLPQDYRSSAGAFYTPPCLVERLLDLATMQGTKWTSAKVLDPAAGAGAFLVQAAMRMRSALKLAEPAFIIQSISTRLLGLELDRYAAELAQASLEIALGDLLVRSGKRLSPIVRTCDTLEEEPSGSFDLVVGNPPYGRVSLTLEQRQRFARGLFGHANLYGVFTDIAIRWAKKRALIAYLTPASFMAGQYFMALRRLLANEAPPAAIEMVHSRAGVFDDVLQETVLALYKKGGQRKRTQIRYIHVESDTEATIATNGQIRLPSDPSKPWLAPRDPSHSSLIAHAERMPTRLRDLGHQVSTGPLVWNRFKSQLHQTAGQRRFPLVWAEAVTSDGRFVFKATKRNHAPYFELKPGDEWLIVNSGCVLVQRTTAKEQARRIIAAEMPASFVAKHNGVVVENHLNMVVARERNSVPPSVIATLLNSRAVDDLFRCMNGSVAVSAFELEALPLPSRAELRPLERLISSGASAAEINVECERLYGRGVE